MKSYALLTALVLIAGVSSGALAEKEHHEHHHHHADSDKGHEAEPAEAKLQVDEGTVVIEDAEKVDINVTEKK